MLVMANLQSYGCDQISGIWQPAIFIIAMRASIPLPFPSPTVGIFFPPIADEAYLAMAAADPVQGCVRPM